MQTIAHPYRDSTVSFETKVESNSLIQAKPSNSSHDFRQGNSAAHCLEPMPDNDDGISLPRASQADRNVQKASAGHCTAFGVVGDDKGIRVQGESLLEHRVHLLINSGGNVANLREQVRFYFGWDPKKQQQHVFDAFATLKTGERIAFAMKPEMRLRSSNRDKVDFMDHMQTVAWWVYEKDFADDVRIFTEADIDPIELHNAQVLNAVREYDAEADLVAKQVIGSLPKGGGVSLCELTKTTGMGARGYRALLRLLRTGDARLQSKVRITPATIVLNGKGCRGLDHLPDRPRLVAQPVGTLNAA